MMLRSRTFCKSALNLHATSNRKAGATYAAGGFRAPGGVDVSAQVSAIVHARDAREPHRVGSKPDA
ncbi:MAG: hypothetical protein VX475_21235 [Myxococcota bacterium]|nr:hypothetical protein [Myxococcota bacterium]